MRIGMLWFDSSKDPLAVKISKAANHYEEKYGRYPDKAYVNWNEFDENVKVDNIVIESSRTVLPGHIWVGCEADE